MKNPHNLKVGQNLFMVKSRDYGSVNERLVVISKVGTKWAQLECGERVNLVGLFIDGGEYSSPGKCYLCEQEYIDIKEKEICWLKIYRSITHVTPNCTLGELKEVARLLRVKT